jgi:endogenous inhibitor of DNA gyrase (YacG/DUF329 family)
LSDPKSGLSPAKTVGCPICGRPSQQEWRPFCTKRCADVDLGRWFRESYVVTEPADPDAGTGALQDDDDEE